MLETLSLATLALSLVAGSLTTLSPCVFPVLPLVVGGSVQENRLAPLAMGAGLVVSFAVLGVLVGVAGPALGLDGDVLRSAGGWLLLLFGAAMLIPRWQDALARWLMPVADQAQQASGRFNPASLSGAFLIGATLGMVWSPCSGPLLGATLTLVATEGGALSGGVLLALFGLGAAIPLVGVAYLSRSTLSRLRGHVLAHSQRVKYVFAFLLIAAGLAVLSGLDKWLEAQILNLLPDSWAALTTRF
ncbi:cytochrome c biogenesis CcdA family protein [Chitinibacteraceae bacterium HSL-7]